MIWLLGVRSGSCRAVGWGWIFGLTIIWGWRGWVICPWSNGIRRLWLLGPLVNGIRRLWPPGPLANGIRRLWPPGSLANGIRRLWPPGPQRGREPADTVPTTVLGGLRAPGSSLVTARL